jgi:hypothetical protein
LLILAIVFLKKAKDLKNNEEKIWKAFEKYKRIGTRIMVIVFQIVLLLEVFY